MLSLVVVDGGEGLQGSAQGFHVALFDTRVSCKRGGEGPLPLGVVVGDALPSRDIATKRKRGTTSDLHQLRGKRGGGEEPFLHGRAMGGEKKRKMLNSLTLTIKGKIATIAGSLLLFDGKEKIRVWSRDAGGNIN